MHYSEQNNEVRNYFNKTMHNKIYSSVSEGKQQCHSCKIHNNLPALVLISFRSLCIYKSIDKHP
jgi:hypothetical protein